VPGDISYIVIFNVITVLGFVGVAIFMIRRARNPNTVPRDPIERAMLPKLANVGGAEKLLFAVLLAVAVAAPWLTRALEK
jgi:hypothetical protein